MNLWVKHQACLLDGLVTLNYTSIDFKALFFTHMPVS